MPRTTTHNADEMISVGLVTALAARTLSLRAAAAQLDMSRNALIHRLARMVKANLAPEALLELEMIRAIHDQIGDVVAVDVANSAPVTEVAKLRAQLHDTKAQLRDAQEQLMGETVLAGVLGGLMASSPRPPAWLSEKPRARTEERSESTPILVLTDWHLGEVVRPSESGGYRYDLEVAGARVKRTIDATLELTRRHLAGLDYPGIIVALGGDMTSGGLHPELAESDQLPLMKSILVATDLVCAVISRMADEFGAVFVPTAVGNHGRFADRKARAKGYAFRNSDWMIYELIAHRFRDDPRVRVTNPDSGETLFSVYGNRILLTHGDMLGARGGHGIIGAVGPVARGAMKTKASFSSLALDVDHLIIGHWHQEITLPDVTVCGSLKGSDEYAARHLRAKAGDPSQMLMMVHPERGITFKLPIQLRDEHCPDRRREVTNKAWVSVFDAA